MPDILSDLRALADNVAAHIWTDVLGIRGDYAGWSEDKHAAATLILEALIEAHEKPADPPAPVETRTIYGKYGGEIGQTSEPPPPPPPVGTLPRSPDVYASGGCPPGLPETVITTNIEAYADGTLISSVPPTPEEET